MNQLFLFPVSFPYEKAAENTFLENEVITLLEYFPEIIIFPSVAEGRKQEIDKRIKIDLSLASYLSINRNRFIEVLLALTNKEFYKEIITNFKAINFKQIIRIIRYSANTVIVKRWVIDYLNKNNLRSANIIMYTYWCTSITLGLGLIKQFNNNITLVSRAHGIDLYEERSHIYFRRRTLELLDAFFLASTDAFNYTINKYPEFKKKYKVSGLGVNNPGFICSSSTDQIFRIVSCSYVDENKRVSLILESLIELCRSNPAQTIRWDHFGDGILFNELTNEVSKISLDNLIITLHGWIDNEMLMQYYKVNCVDLFISLSLSEGGRPVSMQEAQSLGIPLLGTDTGGISEIIKSDVGRLLRIDASLIEISEAISFFINNPKITNKMRIASVKNWEENFNADKNFNAFANELMQLANT